MNRYKRKRARRAFERSLIRHILRHFYPGGRTLLTIRYETKSKRSELDALLSLHLLAIEQAAKEHAQGATLH